MAISDVATFAHLSDADVEALGREFDAIRQEIEESRGGGDAAYIARIITIQRQLMVAGRLTLFASSFPPAWVAGTAHLVGRKDPRKHGDRPQRHAWPVGLDERPGNPFGDMGVGQHLSGGPVEALAQLRASHVHQRAGEGQRRGIRHSPRDQRPEWHPVNLGQPVYYALLALLFEWGVALHDLDIMAIRKREKDSSDLRRQLKGIWRKVRRQVGKDYLIFPCSTVPNFLSTLSANVTANLVRNLWSNIIIFCGHFPDGAEKFTEEELEDESKAEWYLRQLLGSANFEGSRFLHVMAGSLGYQIEHHLFPDLPSNRYPEIAERVRALCEKYDIPYTTGPLYRQYGQTLRTLLRLSLPTRSVTPEPDSPRSRRTSSEELRRHIGPRELRKRQWPDLSATLIIQAGSGEVESLESQRCGFPSGKQPQPAPVSLRLELCIGPQRADTKTGAPYFRWDTCIAYFPLTPPLRAVQRAQEHPQHRDGGTGSPFDETSRSNSDAEPARHLGSRLFPLSIRASFVIILLVPLLIVVAVASTVVAHQLSTRQPGGIRPSVVAHP